jgi:hypothetical protein
VIEM